jgi:hypothetical protein
MCRGGWDIHIGIGRLLIDTKVQTAAFSEARAFEDCHVEESTFLLIHLPFKLNRGCLKPVEKEVKVVGKLRVSQEDEDVVDVPKIHENCSILLPPRH